MQLQLDSPDTHLSTKGPLSPQSSSSLLQLFSATDFSKWDFRLPSNNYATFTVTTHANYDLYQSFLNEMIATTIQHENNRRQVASLQHINYSNDYTLWLNKALQQFHTQRKQIEYTSPALFSRANEVQGTNVRTVPLLFILCDNSYDFLFR